MDFSKSTIKRWIMKKSKEGVAQETTVKIATDQKILVNEFNTKCRKFLGCVKKC